MGSCRTSELVVITKAKELCEYILQITEKSPKRFRFTLTSRIQNYALDVVEYLYRANAIYITNRNRSKMVNRLDLQYQALTELRMLGYVCEIAMRQGCILPKQYKDVSEKVNECRGMLMAWSDSDKKRFEKMQGGNPSFQKQNK